MAAIYMWPLDNQIVLTTTLYPVDVTDSLKFSASFSSGRMLPIPVDHINVAHDVIEATYEQKRWWWEDGPYLDDFNVAHDVIEATFIQKRWWWEDGPYLDQLNVSHDVIEITMINKGVDVETSIEKMKIFARIDTTSTMDAV
jgi:hypothetical protein